MPRHTPSSTSKSVVDAPGEIDLLQWLHDEGPADNIQLPRLPWLSETQVDKLVTHVVSEPSALFPIIIDTQLMIILRSPQIAMRYFTHGVAMPMLLTTGTPLTGSHFVFCSKLNVQNRTMEVHTQASSRLYI